MVISGYSIAAGGKIANHMLYVPTKTQVLDIGPTPPLSLSLGRLLNKYL